MYFESLSANVLSFTESGSGPVNALVAGEVAIGLAMTSPAVLQINEGVPLQILFFEEGSPYSAYGFGMVKGRETRPAVKEVFDFIVNEWAIMDNERYTPEKVYIDREFTLENYPVNIRYSDMSNFSSEEKARLKGKWTLG